jgi:hypothetical protein
VNNESSKLAEQFRRTGVLAFCQNCGAVKSDYRKICKACGSNPRESDRIFARSILMSSQQYYLASKEWKSKTAAQNRNFIESELLPGLIEKASCLQNGKSVSFDPKEEEKWMTVVALEKHNKMPVSLAVFLVSIFLALLILVIFFVKRFFLAK